MDIPGLTLGNYLSVNSFCRRRQNFSSFSGMNDFLSEEPMRNFNKDRLSSSRRRVRRTFLDLDEIQKNVMKYKNSLAKAKPEMDLNRRRKTSSISTTYDLTTKLNIKKFIAESKKISRKSIISVKKTSHQCVSKKSLDRKSRLRKSDNSTTLMDFSQQRKESFLTNITPKNNHTAVTINGDITANTDDKIALAASDYKSEPRNNKKNFDLLENLIGQNNTSYPFEFTKKTGIQDLEMAGKELKKISDELKKLNGKIKKERKKNKPRKNKALR